jgi:hypothetical protein
VQARAAQRERQVRQTRATTSRDSARGEASEAAMPGDATDGEASVCHQSPSIWRAEAGGQPGPRAEPGRVGWAPTPQVAQPRQRAASCFSRVAISEAPGSITGALCSARRNYASACSRHLASPGSCALSGQWPGVPSLVIPGGPGSLSPEPRPATAREVAMLLASEYSACGGGLTSACALPAPEAHILTPPYHGRVSPARPAATFHAPGQPSGLAAPLIR